VADDGERLRNGGPCERLARLDDPLAVETMSVHRDREGSGRDDDVFEVEVADGFLADLDADACLANEPRRALDDRDPGGLQEAGDAADQLVDRCGAALLKVREVAGAGV